MATICLAGALGRDAELKYVGNGATALLSFSVADSVYDSATKEQKTIWYRCNIWGARAEGNLKNYLKKGQYVFVSGELSVSEYRANDGTNKYSLEIRCNDVKLTGKKTGGDTTSRHNQVNDTAQTEDDYDDVPF